jgi:hypothetical protein
MAGNGKRGRGWLLFMGIKSYNEMMDIIISDNQNIYIEQKTSSFLYMINYITIARFLLSFRPMYVKRTSISII